MRTATRRQPTQQPRSEISRKKILDAAIELIGEMGPAGLTLALAAERAGVSRALPTYQFITRRELLRAAATAALEDSGVGRELGLETLFAWMGDQVRQANDPPPRLRARLALLMGPPDPDIADVVAGHWEAQVDRILCDLQRAKSLQQLREDLEPTETAPVLLGMLHGEMARLAFRQGHHGGTFIGLVRAGLARSVGPPTGKRTKAAELDQPKFW